MISGSLQDTLGYSRIHSKLLLNSLQISEKTEMFLVRPPFWAWIQPWRTKTERICIYSLGVVSGEVLGLEWVLGVPP